MKILVFGINGQLGRQLSIQAQLFGARIFGVTRSQCDISNGKSVGYLIDSITNIDLVVNAAAYTAVDLAESEPERAFSVNRDGAENIAAACHRKQLPFIHISTDFVFDGCQNTPYLPSDPVNPLSVYGKSKAEGEIAVETVYDRYLIIRTSWLFSEYGKNFVKTIINLSKEKKEIKVVDDQIGCPTYAKDLADCIFAISRQLAERRNRKWGIYHFCNTGKVSWYDFAQEVIEIAKSVSKTVSSSIVPVSTSEYPTPAKRPPYSVLDCGLLTSRFGIALSPHEKSFGEMIYRLLQ